MMNEQTMEEAGSEKFPQMNASPRSSNLGTVEPWATDEKADTRKLHRRVWDSFKRDPNLHITKKGVVGANGKVFDEESAAIATAESPLARKLKGRHLQMIAIGGSIGVYRLPIVCSLN